MTSRDRHYFRPPIFGKRGRRRAGLRFLILGLVGLLLGLWFRGMAIAAPGAREPIPGAVPLAQVAPGPVLRPVTPWPTGEQWGWDQSLWNDRAGMITALNHSLTYLATPAAVAAYGDYPVVGVTRDRVVRSLRRFRTLLQVSQSAAAFHQAVQREFILYQAIGRDGAGQVHFTGYFEPTFQASRTPSATYPYPLYRRPPDLEQWPLPHPTRAALEGRNGLGAAQGPLAGLELVWLRDRLEAFLVQVQGSARLQLPDGNFFSVGYAGRTEYPYTSLGQELIRDGIIPATELTLERLLTHFRAYPAALDDYIPRNNRFVFFRATGGGPPLGNLSVPVTAGRSIATDKTLMPPGALALVHLPWPQRTPEGTWSHQPTNRYVLDQDTGGAIIGPGRVDIFVGSGTTAGELAGQINTDGSLYYLLLRP